VLWNRHRNKFPREHVSLKSDALDHLVPQSMSFPNVLPRPISNVKSDGWVCWFGFVFNYLESPQSQSRMKILDSALSFTL